MRDPSFLKCLEVSSGKSLKLHNRIFFIFGIYYMAQLKVQSSQKRGGVETGINRTVITSCTIADGF